MPFGTCPPSRYFPAKIVFPAGEDDLHWVQIADPFLPNVSTHSENEKNTTVTYAGLSSKSSSHDQVELGTYNPVPMASASHQAPKPPALNEHTPEHEDVFDPALTHTGMFPSMPDLAPRYQ